MPVYIVIVAEFYTSPKHLKSRVVYENLLTVTELPISEVVLNKHSP
jgi:hypothetical protein